MTTGGSRDHCLGTKLGGNGPGGVSRPSTIAFASLRNSCMTQNPMHSGWCHWPKCQHGKNHFRMAVCVAALAQHLAEGHVLP